MGRVSVVLVALTSTAGVLMEEGFGLGRTGEWQTGEKGALVFEASELEVDFVQECAQLSATRA